MGGAESGPLQEQLPTVVLGNVLGCTAEGQAFAATEVYTHTRTHTRTHAHTHTHTHTHTHIQRRARRSPPPRYTHLHMPAKRPTNACKETY